MKKYKYLFLFTLTIFQLGVLAQNVDVSKGGMDSKLSGEIQVLPWQRERPLREAARSVVLESTLNPTDPTRSAMSINNLKMHTTLWGTPDRITISITKNNVWDRRLHEFKAPTLQEITEGAFSPANKYYEGVKEIESSLFAKVDFTDLLSLSKKLSQKTDPISVFLSPKLTDKNKAALAALSVAKNRSSDQEQILLADLAANLNIVVNGPSIYDEKRFQDIRLRPETEELLKKNAQGPDLALLNRYLLEDAYPQEISRKPGNSLRSLDLGWLRKEGGSYDPYRYPMRYAFPCLKPVGQIIVGIDPMAGANATQVTQSCANGVTSLQLEKDGAKAKLDYVLGMTSNVYAIRGDLSGINSPVFVRLYRHRDTAHMPYMTADGKTYTNPDAVADSAYNGPIDSPTSGKDGRYFWIRQKMPAEKTFPNGFEYVMMGVITSGGDVNLDAVEGKTGLGTPPANSPMPWDWFGIPRPDIAKVPGAAATATVKPKDNSKLVAFVIIVTTMDGADLLDLAKKRLKAAETGGFDGIVRENTTWWNKFYDQRENGRVFFGLSGNEVSDNLRNIYRSWTDSHGGGTKTDMRQFECSASYALPERDFQEFDSAPCYNEIFYTNRFVQNWGDSEDMWKQIIQHWMPGGKQNARDMFGMPGMFITHGYLPPIKPDKYVHTAITLELCMGTMAQIVRPAWDEWDYGGNVTFLKKECYPIMREMALFYAAYAKKGADGYYHIAPTMEEERWGIYPEFSRNKDITSSLCMFRWGLTRAADAADFLGIDTDLSKQWRQIAAQLAPYPTWQKPEGLIFAGMPGVEPRHLPRDHFGDAAAYPTILADDINLDSPKDQRDMMIRSVQTLRSGHTNQTLMLLGRPVDQSLNRRGTALDAEMLLNSRSGRIYLFPLTPSKEIAFRNFQARGGFWVSACRNSDGVYYIEIQPQRNNTCALMNPWPGKNVVVREPGNAKPVPFKLDKTNGECIMFATLAGRKYVVEKQ